MKKILSALALIFMLLFLGYIYHINRVTREGMGWKDMVGKVINRVVPTPPESRRPLNRALIDEDIDEEGDKTLGLLDADQKTADRIHDVVESAENIPVWGGDIDDPSRGARLPDDPSRGAWLPDDPSRGVWADDPNDPTIGQSITGTKRPPESEVPPGHGGGYMGGDKINMIAEEGDV